MTAFTYETSAPAPVVTAEPAPSDSILQLVDGFCFIYKIIALADKYNLEGKERATYIVRSIAWIQSGGLFDDIHPVVIWALDSDRSVSPYWRTEVFVDYKCKRTERSEEARKIAAYIQRTFPSVLMAGYEADDIIGATVSLFNAGQLSTDIATHVAITTVDSDLMGLASSNVTWVNVNSHKPRARGHVEVYDWLASKHCKQSKRKQRLWELPAFSQFSPTDIWDWKQAVGDTADSLPENSSAELINLFNPPENRKLWLNNDFLKALSSAMTAAQAMKSDLEPHDCVRALLDTGMVLPIQPTLLEPCLSSRM